MPKKSISSIELEKIIANQNKNEEYLLHHYREKTKNIIKSLNTLIGKNCQAFPYRFKCISYGDVMYDKNKLIGSKRAKPPLTCIPPQFQEEQIIIYAHLKNMTNEAASYLEFEVLNDKSEVHILASCTFGAHERKNLSVLLRFVPIFLMLSYKLKKVTSDTNELSGNLLVKKLGFTRTEKYAGDTTHYHETYLKSTNVEEKYLKEQFVNTVCGTSNITERLPFLRQNVRKRKILSPATLKNVPNITLVKDLEDVNDYRKLYAINSKIIKEKNYRKEKQRILDLEKEYNALCVKYLKELSQDLSKMPITYLKRVIKSVKNMWEDLDLDDTEFDDLNVRIEKLVEKIEIVYNKAQTLKKVIKKEEEKNSNPRSNPKQRKTVKSNSSNSSNNSNSNNSSNSSNNSNSIDELSKETKPPKRSPNKKQKK
jgi:hypothetical protein